MKDEFPITRLFCLNIKNISSVIFHHIAVDTSRYNRFYKEDILNSLRKCEQDIDDLDNNLNYAEWSPWNWPQMIRELIDSVEYRAELQDAYDKWIEMVSKVKVYGEKEFSRLIEGRKEGNPIDELGISLLRRISRMMKAMFILIQELKIEYNLYDKDDYNLSPAFIAFYETVDYFNGPAEQVTPNEETIAISTKVKELFSTNEDCDNFFNDGDSLDCAGWARRAFKYTKGDKLYFHAKGDRKNLYEEIKKRHPQIADVGTFTHTLNNLNNGTLK